MEPTIKPPPKPKLQPKIGQTKKARDYEPATTAVRSLRGIDRETKDSEPKPGNS